VADPTVFALAVLAVLATPGPTNTLMAVAGAMLGVSRGLKLIPAEVAGYLTSISLLMFIFQPVVAALPLAATVLRFGCGSYLAILALTIWRSSKRDAVQTSLVSFQRVFVTTLLNPKSLIFADFGLPRGVLCHLHCSSDHVDLHWRNPETENGSVSDRRGDPSNHRNRAGPIRRPVSRHRHQGVTSAIRKAQVGET
jgi:hypothetical protein